MAWQQSDFLDASTRADIQSVDGMLNSINSLLLPPKLGAYGEGSSTSWTQPPYSPEGANQMAGPSSPQEFPAMRCNQTPLSTGTDRSRLLEQALRAECAALEASFDDARREVEHQTRRRYMAEHSLATARTEIGRLKAAYMAMQVEREEWLKREEQFRETFSLTEARAEQSTLEAQKAQNELRLCREELAEFQHAQLTAGSAAPVHDACGFVHSSLQGGDIEAEVLELCQRLEEEAKVLTVKLDREDGNADAESGRSWSTTSVGWSDPKKGCARSRCFCIWRFCMVNLVRDRF